MLNYIWLGLVLLAVVIGGYNGALEQVANEGFLSAKKAVMDLALPLSAIITLWLGIMRLVEKSGLIFLLARALRPVMRWLFPEVPGEHPAMGAMLMNFAANMLGLNNAATPLGLRAMEHLEKLNPHPGTATNAMCMFLTINTSSIQLIPATTIGILAVNGSTNSTAIVGTAFMATLCSTVVGVSAAKFFERFSRTRRAAAADDAGADPVPVEPQAEPLAKPQKISPMGKLALIAFVAMFGYFFFALIFPDLRLQNVSPKFFPDLSIVKTGTTDATIPQTPFTRVVQAISVLAVPFFLSFFPLYAALSRVKVYEEFVEGAKEGFHVAIKIIPFLVAILMAVGMFRGAGGIELLSRLLGNLLAFVGFPVQLLPLVLMRPLSGSGSNALLLELIQANGPDSLVSRMGATIMGSTETTFYVIAVYFGSVAIRRTRHAVASGLLADLAGVIAAIIICRMMFT